MQKYTLHDKQKFDDIFWNKKYPWEVEKQYIEKTIKYIKYIKWIPGIKMIGIWNSISMNSATLDSDIDLFIVSDNNRMWLVRILCTLIFQVLWVRKTEKKHAWRMCLSFFCTLKTVDFWEFSLEKDPYLYFWILYFKPLLDNNGTYSLFLEKNKSWADFSEFGNIIEENKSWIKYSKEILSTEGFNPLKKKEWKYCFPTKILNIINNLLKKLFLPKTLRHYKKLWKPFWIIINDNMLKFHNWDIRKQIAKKMW